MNRLPWPVFSLWLVVAALLAGSVSVSAELTREALVQALEAESLAGADFTEAQGPGIMVRGRNLSHSLWLRADLRGATLADTNLTGAQLAGANLRGASLVGVNLSEADLSGCDLSGALLQAVNLAGANLSGVRMFGTGFQQIMLSATGGTHGDGLRLALQRATGSEFSRAWVSGLSGDAFAFVYNNEDPGYWPGTPFTHNPVLAAAGILGLEVSLRHDAAAEKILGDSATLTDKVLLLPLQAEEADLWLLRGMPLWSLVDRRETRDRRTFFTVVMPPMGDRELTPEALLADWKGPWETLEPMGSGQAKSARPLYVFTRADRVPALREQARGALAQAISTIMDRRTYGPLTPGEAGFLRLSAELRAVAAHGDLEAARRVAMWGSYPRECTMGARREAAEFCDLAARQLDGEAASGLREAAALYRSSAGLLQHQWPGLAFSSQSDLTEVRRRYGEAAEVVQAVAASERRCAEIFGRIIAQQPEQ